MTGPAFLFKEPIQETYQEKQEEFEEIIFEDNIDEQTKLVREIIEKEIYTKNKIIKNYFSNNKYFFEFYDDDSVDWESRVKEYELYLNADVLIEIIHPNNPERVLKNYD